MPPITTTSTSFSINFFTANTSVDTSTGTITVGNPTQGSIEYHNPAPVKKKAGNNIIAAPTNEGIPMGSELLVYYKRNRPPGRYEEGHRHQGDLPYQNIQDLLARFFIKVHYESGPISNWREWCIGISSVIFRDNAGRPLRENLHMPMFDYDGKNIKSILRKDVELLQEKWRLGPATIFQTKKGFHVYFMTDAVTWKSYHDMLKEVKCCEGFKHCALNAGYAILRVSAKYSHSDIKLDNVMLPKEAKALPARKLRKARVIEAILSLGERCGTHFASLCPEWANYREDAAPWKPSAPRKKTALAPNEPGYPPADEPLQKKSKLVLKPRRPAKLSSMDPMEKKVAKASSKGARYGLPSEHFSAARYEQYQQYIGYAKKPGYPEPIPKAAPLRDGPNPWNYGWNASNVASGQAIPEPPPVEVQVVASQDGYMSAGQLAESLILVDSLKTISDKMLKNLDPAVYGKNEEE